MGRTCVRVGVIWMTASLGGCAAPPVAAPPGSGVDLVQANRPASRPRPAPPAAPPVLGVPEPASAADLARRAEADVAAMRSLSGAAPVPPQPAPLRVVAAQPPEIHWNLPAAPPTAVDAPAAAAAPQVALADPPASATPASSAPAPASAPPATPVQRDEPAPGAPGPTAAAPPAAPGPQAAAGSALDADRVGELMVALSREVYRESAYADAPLPGLMVIAAQALMRPDRSLSADAIPGLDPAERQTLERFQGFCQDLGEKLRSGGSAAAALEETVGRLRAALVERPLRLATTALCHRVDGFGDFDPFDRNAFLAHSEQRVIVYLEIDGFTSEQNQRGEWVTELSQQLVIYSDRDGIPVWSAEWQPAVDLSRNRRKDFFTVQIVTLPKALSVGRYQLKVSLRDQKSGAESEAAVEFEMVADPKLAARTGG